MPATELTVTEWINLLSHLKKWLANLRRAKQQRKNESREALRSVITAIRETEVYVRQLRESGKKSLKTERKLSLRWTNLSFRLEDLGLSGLAKRCQIKGKYWADQSRFTRDFLDKAGTRLSDVERLALLTLKQIDD
jgi:hypothetical protein